MNLLLLVALSVAVKGVSFTPMEVERLPELNIPRQAHSLHYAGGEYTVIGGHTVGFVPTATAEYYRGGKWHTVNTLYPHDAGFATLLHTNTTYISATLNSGLGMSFPRFVTSYRVRYAQEQMLCFPEKNLSRIAEEAGFANDNSFFRAFKTETGLTPTEWREKHTS